MTWKIIQGNAAEPHQEIGPESVHCVVTSPPYLSLRNYQTDGCYWPEMEYHLTPLLPPLQVPAWNGELGAEATPEAFVGHLVLTMRQVWRVLRNDGTVWLNIGDSYAGSGQGWNKKSNDGRNWLSDYGTDRPANYISSRGTNGVKPKDLFLVPELLALALRSEGWYVRSRIIWHKPDAQPESAVDRLTRCYEHVWLLSKQKDYFFDYVAIRELGIGHPGKAGTFSRQSGKNTMLEIPGQKNCSHRPGRDDRVPLGRNKRDVWTIPTNSPSWAFCASCQTLYRSRETNLIEIIKEGNTIIKRCPQCKSTDGWVAHYAPFPPGLAAICMSAGSSPRTCEKCGAPWKRITEEKSIERYELPQDDPRYRPARYVGKYDAVKQGGGTGMRYHEVKTVGWGQTCNCENDGSGRSVVLDPFSGSGTTPMVAEQMGRDSVAIEANPVYCDVIEARMQGLQQGALSKDGEGEILRQATLF
jgi:DNA modification methylase